MRGRRCRGIGRRGRVRVAVDWFGGCGDGVLRDGSGSGEAQATGAIVVPPVACTETNCPYFLFLACVNAEAAAVLAGAEEFGLRRTLLAAVAARGLVVSLR
jgi:hypothetical protein